MHDSDLFEECVDSPDNTKSPSDYPTDASSSSQTTIDSPGSDPPSPNVESFVEPPKLRHTTISIKQLIWTKDYVVPTRKQPSKYPITNHLSNADTTTAYDSYWQNFPT